MVYSKKVYLKPIADDISVASIYLFESSSYKHMLSIKKQVDHKRVAVTFAEQCLIKDLSKHVKQFSDDIKIYYSSPAI